ncbi:cytochrome C [Geomonas nitrogeniifigens]|uniref:Cytochrome C n=1 Tax=Geomonas diazotrophica TaxID=2843197 RepID=A0ABX8JLV2_9BACT|nr:cytochrome c3 family protein [Geomonas nitrogeniifigens]QWV96420.1 cytochrome C [Geomonas nitrogeniifigens]
MKKQATALTALAALALGATIAYAGSTPGSGIVGSKHDMYDLAVKKGADYGTPDSQKRVCAYCHTPHHKVDSTVADYNPLWSHTIEDSTGFQAYASYTFDGVVADPLVGPSRLCMSCHDGAIAIDQHYGIPGTMNTSNTHLTGDSWGQVAVGSGQSLAGDHPIGFDISAAAWQDAGAGVGGMPIFGGAINTTLQTTNPKLTGQPFTSIGFDTKDGKLMFTCASCHEVHNKDNQEAYFLYEKQEGSAICLMCHNK